jgi:hypothetical protein
MSSTQEPDEPDLFALPRNIMWLNLQQYCSEKHSVAGSNKKNKSD